MEPSNRSHSIIKPARVQGLWPSRSHGRNIRALSSVRASVGASLLAERTPPGSTNQIIKMRMFAFTHFCYVTPVADAALALKEFYSSIALKAGGVWQAQPQSTRLTIKEGAFQLSFSSAGDTIPWAFVRETAERLWKCACLGMAELFDATFIDDASQVAVSIAVRLVGEGSSPGSGSGSGTDYREGSVPSVTSP